MRRLPKGTLREWLCLRQLRKRHAFGDRSLFTHLNITFIGTKTIMANLTGTANNDIFQGTIAADLIQGLAGNDSIIGNSGDDIINAGLGYDTVNGAIGLNTWADNDEWDNDLLIVDYSSNTYTGNDSGISSSNYIANPYSTENKESEGYFSAYYNSNYEADRVEFYNINRFQITGTGANDNIQTGDGNDTIVGGAGNDYISSNYGNDSINGGIGNDIINAGDGNNTIASSDGNDTIFAGDGNDMIASSDGNDTIYADGGNDTITSGEGNDTIANGGGIDTINAGAGTDTLADVNFGAATTALSFSDTINYSSPIVLTNGTSISNVEKFTNVTTGSGNDTISYSQRNENYFTTGSGDDTINAGLGFDYVNGGQQDFPYSGGDNDLLIVNYSSNTYTGSDDSGIFSSTTSNEQRESSGYFSAYYNSNYEADRVEFYNINRFQITGTAANDDIQTGDGNDTIVGGVGNDTISSHAGNDGINGGAGTDTLIGGAGSDRFIYNTNAAFVTSAVGKDLLTDFTSGTDKIVLDKTTFTAFTSIAGSGFSVNSEFAVVGSDTAVATASALIVYSSGTGNLFYNQNGVTSGFGSGGQFATLSEVPALNADDFILQA
ncbi:MAG: calcium-binding protein [Waterburya sp.]